MFFQIKEIILWPKNPGFAPRRLRFQAGMVNIISGASRTGKSAVIPIIDYCLGSRSCSIPVKTIRDACAWFGVVVQTTAGEKLLARQEPGSQRSTDDMFIMEAAIIEEIPAIVIKNTNAANVRGRLDELAGLSNLDFGAGDSQSGFEARPSFRDLSAFTFQPQNVIANPDVLFFKTNTYEHREKLRKIFPYILGAITPALLAKQHELRRLQAELRRKEREMKEAEEVSSRWQAELHAKVSEARELGLIAAASDGELSREQMLLLLLEIVERTDIILSISAETISDAVRELNELEAEESKVSREITGLRRRLIEMDRIRESASNYHESLRIQRDRLQLSAWLGQHRTGDENCPVCGSHMEPSEAKMKQLKASLVNIEEEAGYAFEIPVAFDREIQRVQSEASVGTETLKAIQIRKKALSLRSQEAKTTQYQANKVERFIGNLENALKLYQQLGEDGDLRKEVVQLRNHAKILDEELRSENVEYRKRRAVNIVNANAARLMPMLDSERPYDPVSLEINDLSVKIIGTNRDDYLSEIGSGSNWLSYHIAMILALQQYFLSLTHSPVPGFIVIDQPSQVYFPKKVVVQENDEIEEPQFKDEDIEAVRKAFNVMGEVVGAAKGCLQIIVLDHAAGDVWGNIPNIVAFEEWRDGVKLIPTEWLL